MKKLLLPLILLLIGTGGGVGAGIFLRPDPAPIEEAALSHPCGEIEQDDHVADADSVAVEPLEDVEYAKLSNQFIVPVVSNDRIDSMVVISLSIEVPTGQKDPIFSAEPRLRDAFLQVFFNHANIGGFSGNYTSAPNMRTLREELVRSARGIVGSVANDVLILDIVRQDT